MPDSDRPWLERDFKDGTIFSMPVQYIIDYLDKRCRVKVLTTKDYWQQSKESRLETVLDEGLPPEEMNPIEIALDPREEKYQVNDGITRLRVFRKRNIGKINVKLYHG